MPARLPNPYRPEGDVAAIHLAVLSGWVDWAEAAEHAKPWVQAVRKKPPPFWALERLLQEYPISSPEGVALMRLAEALMRVPDVNTAVALMADQLGQADFAKTSGGDHYSVLARLSASAIDVAKKLVLDSSAGAGDANATDSLISRLGARSVVAAALRAVQLLGRQFVLGQTIESAMEEAASVRYNMSAALPTAADLPGAEAAVSASGSSAPPGHGDLRFSYDMLGEGARTARDADSYLEHYKHAIKSIASRAVNIGACERNDGLSIKLSALHPRFEAGQHARVMAELVPRVWGLCELAAKANIPLTIDAEEVDRLELSLDVFEALAVQIAAHHPGWQGFGLALQAYQTRSLDLVHHVIGLARKYRLRLMCRLVKGAYWDAEIKRTQELGLPHYPVFTHKHHTDVAYLACAQALLGASDAIYPQFAGHNAGTIAAILQLANKVRRHAPPLHGSLSAGEVTAPAVWQSQSRGLGWPVQLTQGRPQFELQRLHGMGEGIFREVLKNPGATGLLLCRIYAPVGPHRDLLAYLVRRLLENGANSSFVHQLADESVGMDTLLRSPLHLEPAPSLPLPANLFGPVGSGARVNSAGVDLAVHSTWTSLQAALDSTDVPHVPVHELNFGTSPVAACQESFPTWSKTPVAERAAILRRAAHALQAQLPHFCALLVKEAFKTWGDAVSEVREAVDFLRYYADEAERIMRPTRLPCGVNGVSEGVTGETNELRLTARGVWVCISPWNFPLAIFMGQVAAALSTGNTVAAKPAEQTPGVALEAVKLLHQAGVPEKVLQLFHGPGETVGAALVAAPGVAGVVFTGSSEVARIINRALAAKDGPITPLIAETGGVNAMLVDSTALPEQVADAVVQSAFRSAGQRCSALRLLCVHESLADPVIAMIQGAAQELGLGLASDLATDVGPVIDRAAFDHIEQHLKRLRSTAKVLLSRENFAGLAAHNTANLVAPSIFEVARIADVSDEIFGPVLQIVRWGSGEMSSAEAVIDQINALGSGADPGSAARGYGLTLGIQTRIDSRARALAARAQSGNVYVNRNIIGAVVGVQPFGGGGLSGTGPKAGGPHYLLRFCTEQTVTVNSTAAGGNVTLMAG